MYTGQIQVRYTCVQYTRMTQYTHAILTLDNIADHQASLPFPIPGGGVRCREGRRTSAVGRDEMGVGAGPGAPSKESVANLLGMSELSYERFVDFPESDRHPTGVRDTPLSNRYCPVLRAVSVSEAGQVVSKMKQVDFSYGEEFVHFVPILGS